MEALSHALREKVKRNESKEGDGHHNDMRMLNLRGSKSKDRASHGSPGPAPALLANLSVAIESPPLCCYGLASNSTGALLSGLLRLSVADAVGEVKLKSLAMSLRAAIATKKPIQKDCSDCKERYDELKEWTFLSESRTFKKGSDHQFPFSFLFPGHLPATTTATLGSISYSLVATATTSTSETIHVTHPLTLQRAIPPTQDKTSIRIFPPTNLTCRVVLPPVIHPIGTFPVQMTLSGVVEKRQDTQTRWRLRKMMWRIEEHTKMISAPCSKHAHKIGGASKGVEHSDSKTVGSDDLKHGWKTDFDTAGGEITLEFEASLIHQSSKKALCDVSSPAGLEVRHNLVIELIVAEEFCPNKNTSLITPTGAARILRMQFAIIVTERAGMGISWDEEMPPVYEDVPASPPGYGTSDRNDGAFGGAIVEDYHGPELEYVDLERLPSENPNEPPRYRERDPAEYRDLPTRSPQIRASSPRQRPRRNSSDRSMDFHTLPTPRVSRWTEEELAAEPPQYALRQREVSSTSMPEEDVAEGIARSGSLHNP